MTREEVLVVMGMLGLSRTVAEKWVPNERDIAVTLNLGYPCAIGRAEVLKTEQRVHIRAAPTAGGGSLGFWVPGEGYDLWAVHRSPNDAREWCLLTGHKVEGWCASQYVRRL